MGAKSKIEWTDATWSPVTGCTKVSDGCKHCYAESLWPRFGKLPDYAGRKFTDVRYHYDRLDQPFHWKKPRRIFVNSMSDLFHPDVPDEFISRVFDVIQSLEQHTFQILTKRPKRMYDFMLSETKGRESLHRDYPHLKMPWPFPNVWLGVSVENQETSDERIPLLLQTPAAVRFVSCEPLLGPVDFEYFVSYGFRGDGISQIERVSPLEGKHFVATSPSEKFIKLEDEIPRIDWVIIGCESGPKRRLMEHDWALNIVKGCQDADVPVFVKQLEVNGELVKDIAHLPASLQVREYPR
jgi:protein gp37